MHPRTLGPRSLRIARRAALPVLATLLIATAGCQKPEPQPLAGERVESPDLGLALASVPVGFELAASSADGVQLSGNTPETTGGSIYLSAGPEEPTGINLIAESQARIDNFSAIGTSFGSRELNTPIGSAFTVRGRRPGDAGEIEETWIYALHPLGDRLVTMRYEYPAAEDTQARINQVLEVLGEVEGLAAP